MGLERADESERQINSVAGLRRIFRFRRVRELRRQAVLHHHAVEQLLDI